VFSFNPASARRADNLAASRFRLDSAKISAFLAAGEAIAAVTLSGGLDFVFFLTVLSLGFFLIAAIIAGLFAFFAEDCLTNL